ncbi:copper resistance CopC family protein [Microbispora amethystogenes]|uniref:copper resistance CopC family protein n=1 Tax=Microbispora amethystogenes TaxID=1427754 RepID=UPI001EF1E3EA|nr:copper resistance CopC family protein [Microbispora amethystogenes]
MDQVARARTCHDAPAPRGGRRTAGRTAPPAPARLVPRTPARLVPPAPAQSVSRVLARRLSRVLALRVPSLLALRVPSLLALLARPVLALLAAPVLALVAVTLVATPASAHNVLVSSDPKDGAALDSLPHTVTLTFDQAVRRDFARIAVTGPDGAHYEDGDVTVEGGKVSIAVRPPAPWGKAFNVPAGSYAIGYRIVSNDGHPVTGTIRFTLPTGYVNTDVVDVQTVDPKPGTGLTSAAGSQGGGGWVWGLLIFTAALLALCTLVLFRHDRRVANATPGHSAAGEAG